MSERIVRNLTRFWFGAGAWAFPPHHVQRLPEEGVTAEMLEESAREHPRLVVEDAEPEPLVVIDMDNGN